MMTSAYQADLEIPVGPSRHRFTAGTMTAGSRQWLGRTVA